MASLPVNIRCHCGFGLSANATAMRDSPTKATMSIRSMASSARGSVELLLHFDCKRHRRHDPTCLGLQPVHNIRDRYAMGDLLLTSFPTCADSAWRRFLQPFTVVEPHDVWLALYFFPRAARMVVPPVGVGWQRLI